MKPVDPIRGELGSAETVRVTPDADGTLGTMTDAGASSRTSAPAIARETIGRYRVLAKLGAGGMGTVYAAEDPDLDRKVAIKLLHGSSAMGSARLGREARSLAKLRHPNVVTVYEVGRDGDDSFVAMEHVEGVTLREWLAQPHALAARLDALTQAGRGLAAAHAVGLVHRDFKPENVMVGAGGRVQVLDFGLAKSAGDAPDPDGPASRDTPRPLETLTRSGALMGTPAYMAPEQFEAAPTDARTDQFAFAVVAFEALHGFRPFAGTSYDTLADAVTTGTLADSPRSPDVPPRIQAAIERGFSVAPAARFASLDELIAELRLDLAASPPPPPRRRRRLALGWAGAGIAVLAAGAWLAVSRDPSPTVAAPAADPRAALLAASNLPPELLTPLPNDPLKVTVHRLSNGLTVWISPNRKSPRISASFVVRAGSRDVPPGAGGVAHIVEHMLNKGTSLLGTTDFAAESPHLAKLRALYAARDRATTDADRAALLAQIDTESVEASRFAIPSELDRATAALGVTRSGATTDADTATWTADLPSNRFAQWAALEGERWRDPVFRLFHSEIGVVFSEVETRRTRDPANAVMDESFAALFPDHPYAHPFAGTLAEIAAEPFTAAEEFLHTWYVPNNAALFLVGDIDASVAIPVLERELGRWEPRALPPRARPESAPPSAPAPRTVHGAPDSFRLFAYRAPPRGADDALVMTALAELVDRLGSAHPDRGKTESWSLPRLDGSVFGLWSIAAPGHTLDEASASTEELLRALEAGDFSDEQFAAVRTNLLATMDYAHDDNGPRMVSMIDAYTTGQRWNDAVGLEARVASLTKADIVRVANRYLRSSRATVNLDTAELPPPDVKAPAVTPLAPDAHATSAFVRDLLAEEAVVIPPHFVSEGRDYFVRDTPAGPAIATQNSEDKSAAVVMHWDVTEAQRPFVCAAVPALWQAGLPGETAAQLRERWYALAGTIEVSCDATGVQLAMLGPDASLDRAWTDALAWLDGAGVTDDVWKTSAVLQQQEIARPRVELEIVEALADRAAYGADGHRTRPSRAQIAGGSAAAARAALHELTGTVRWTSYVGPRALAALPVASTVPLRAPPPERPRRFVRADRPRILATATKSPGISATIRIALGALDPGQRALAQTLAAYYAGSGGGVLLDQIRTRRGAGYTTQARLDVPDLRADAPSLLITLDSSPEQLADVLELVIGVAHAPLDATQFERARREVEDRFRSNWISPRELPGEVVSWRRHGETGDPRQAEFERVLRVEPRDGAAMLARLAAGPTYVSIVGDLSAIDAARLAKLGTVEVVPEAALFAP